MRSIMIQVSRLHTNISDTPSLCDWLLQTKTAESTVWDVEIADLGDDWSVGGSGIGNRHRAQASQRQSTACMEVDSTVGG